MTRWLCSPLPGQTSAPRVIGLLSQERIVLTVGVPTDKAIRGASIAVSAVDTSRESVRERRLIAGGA